ncbi:hypothetical protein SAMD00019534_085380 [Acytostelium subglobosum LB1]|uniref:hypothetical protein n=1 Tax=Acytostelium subglobosum LB1 TaxID=1410327 RepID=UPI000644A731|nr:hypothetical protein SAMD00019534_085380 [Acytostelium subglobosum LB1]GAM25363.1 hypothetical protein SAMD00019534_085380 [Acytostelium subglobosum LB1]|eukprot:XP_012751883.1 hypothetical protein SAMD00019534_085380 [Acytostelium subglobosum LB1]
MTIVTVAYCKVCGLPTEYCEFGPTPAECLAVNGPQVSDVAAGSSSSSSDNTQTSSTDNTSTTSTTTTSTDSTSDKLQQLKIVDDSKDESHTTAASTTDATAPAAAAAAPAKKKKEVRPTITIELSQRTKRKHVTTICGLDAFGIKLSDATKLMAKKFSCGCSVIKTASGTEEIDIQGDFQEDAVDFILDKWKVVSEGDIYFLEDKKKVKAR